VREGPSREGDGSMQEMLWREHERTSLVELVVMREKSRRNQLQQASRLLIID